MRRLSLGPIVLAAALLAGCGGSGSKPATTSGVPSPPVGADRWGTVWLCRPGLVRNPCAGNLTATVVGRDGSTRIERASPARRPPVDCFYVYPTVSAQQTPNASLRIDPQERAVAAAQAARFSQACRVFAPMYRQITLPTILRPSGITLPVALTAYASLRAGFADYLAHYNRGRGIVFVGHSQGTSLLTALLRREVDDRPSVRRLFVSALLLGGNVTVSKGRAAGGNFAHIPACRSAHETGCVVAYSSFARTPPADSLFGRAGKGLNPFGSTEQGLERHVLCVNPAAPGGGTAALDPYFPVSELGLVGVAGSAGVKTPWVAYPDAFTARCESSGGATWLQVSRLPGGSAPDTVALGRTLGARWGLHIVDVNIALGNLVALVKTQAAAFRR